MQVKFITNDLIFIEIGGIFVSPAALRCFRYQQWIHPLALIDCKCIHCWCNSREGVSKEKAKREWFKNAFLNHHIPLQNVRIIFGSIFTKFCTLWPKNYDVWLQNMWLWRIAKKGDSTPSCRTAHPIFFGNFCFKILTLNG